MTDNAASQPGAFRQAFRLVRALPDLVAERLWRYALARHEPEDLSKAQDCSALVCVRCMEEFPCAEYERIARRAPQGVKP